jgi:hypothetical protein
MPKPKLSDFKKFLAELSHEELKAEMLKLFQKLPQVQDFYVQELSSETDRRKMLEEYKKKIYKEFWTPSGYYKNTSNSKIRTMISDFEKVCVSQSELIELILYRVDVALHRANEFGMSDDSEYDPAINAFEKAVKIVEKERLIDSFYKECHHIARDRGNMNGWAASQMNNLIKEHLG